MHSKEIPIFLENLPTIDKYPNITIRVNALKVFLQVLAEDTYIGI